MHSDNHYQKKIKFCPACGRLAQVNEWRKIVCCECGFELYFNAAAATAALIYDSEGRLLVTKRNHEPEKGFLDLPGGFVDFNENAESALRRELLEELNLEIEQTRYFCSIPNTYIYSDIKYHTLDIFFICEPKDLSVIKHNEEIMEVLFKFPDQICAEEVGFSSMKKLLDLLKKTY
ncbi:MAG: NUDIX domain-containing protein [Chitinispirillales bacterium]|jgi:NADH pyrophosphatase NudC (nudix superfamily)|nr:NUDIX domain-containing protein [Chitinispirillales bacterium]